MKIKFFLLIVYVLTSTSTYSSEKQIKILDVYKNLRCLVCQGQSIADSNSDFATTIKLVVQDQLTDGKTKDEIYTFLIFEYLVLILIVSYFVRKLEKKLER